jgi:hypothetical protein
MQTQIDRKELLARLEEARAAYFSHKVKEIIEYLQAVHQVAQVKIAPELHKLDTFAPNLENNFEMPLLMRVFEYDPKNRPSMTKLENFDRYINFLKMSRADNITIDENDAVNLAAFLGDSNG